MLPGFLLSRQSARLTALAPVCCVNIARICCADGRCEAFLGCHVWSNDLPRPREDTWQRQRGFFMSPEKVVELFYFRDGMVFWNISLGRKIRAGARAGNEQFRPDGSRKCRRIRYEGHAYKEHHIVWCLVTGSWPDGQLDHKDGDPFNNNFSNLRPASHSQNMRNRRKPVTNTSGLKGAYYITKRGVWGSCISVDNKNKHLGSFATREQAHKAYCSAAEKLFGEFARFD